MLKVSSATRCFGRGLKIPEVKTCSVLTLSIVRGVGKYVIHTYIHTHTHTHTYMMEYYSAIKRNKTGSFAETWMDRESVIQTEGSQKEKHITLGLLYSTDVTNAYVWNLKKRDR